MNKKGFTLIELLAVIAIIALISLVAIPNIVGLSTNVRKDQMLDDAKKLISNAKYLVNKSYNIRKNPPKVFSYNELNANGDIQSDPDGGSYDTTRSKVTYTVENNVEKYCVILIGSKRSIKSSNGGCVYEESLYSRSNVIDNE